MNTKININIKRELINIILNNDNIKNTYINKHPNSKYSLENIIDELMYFLKSGVSWRMLRSNINYNTLRWHFIKFVNNNIFELLFNKLKNKFTEQYKNIGRSLYIDSTIVYNKYGTETIGRNKFYKNKNASKISLVTDSTGFPLSVIFMNGNKHDNSVFSEHIDEVKNLFMNITVVADKAYSSKKNYKLLNDNNIAHIIPPRRNMKIYKQYKYNKKQYIKRIKIEHMFAILKQYKRVELRYDKNVITYKNFVLFALSEIAYNILNKLNK